MIPSVAFMIRRRTAESLTYSYSYLSCCLVALESFTPVGSKEGIPGNGDDEEA